MRNILLIQLETKVALVIIAIIIVIFLITVFRSLDNFDEFINQLNVEQIQLSL